MLYSDQREFSFPFHNKLVKLYAVYDKTKIMPLLHVSSYIDLEPALNTVKSYGLIPETVYLLSKYLIMVPFKTFYNFKTLFLTDIKLLFMV